MYARLDAEKLEAWIKAIRAYEVKFKLGDMLAFIVHPLALLCLLTFNLSMFHQNEFSSECIKPAPSIVNMYLEKNPYFVFFFCFFSSKI